jgi:DNA mismatch endonuclease (patch repair protein)
MRAVKSASTAPELIVRSALHRQGYRYKLQNALLPGKPDLCFPRWRVAMFVHGCFWHRHPHCKRAALPRTRRTYWLDKFQRNVQRDRLNEKALKRLGWTVITIWECELRNGRWLEGVRTALPR